MENRPKNMPRWQWNKLKETEKEEKDLLQKKLLDVQPVHSNIIGTIIMTIIIVGFLYIGYLSLSGPAFECSPGYHIEGYTTAYGEVVDECYKD